MPKLDKYLRAVEMPDSLEMGITRERRLALRRLKRKNKNAKPATLQAQADRDALDRIIKTTERQIEMLEIGLGNGLGID